MIYIKSIVVVSSNNNKFLAISTCINKDLFIILPITKIYIYIYIYINTGLKLKKKKKLSTTITKVQLYKASQEDAKMATQGLLVRPTHKKHKTNSITPITQKKKIIIKMKAQTFSQP